MFLFQVNDVKKKKKKSNEKIRRNYRKTGSQDKYQSLNWFGFTSTIYETVSLITMVHLQSCLSI